MPITTNKKSKKIIAVKKSKVTQLNIALVLDESGSMAMYKQHVLNAVNKNFADIKSEAAKTKILTRLSLFTFSERTVTPCVTNEDVSTIDSLDTTSYNPAGGTPLHDGLASAIEEIDGNERKGHANLVIVITDGEENASKVNAQTLTTIVKERIKSGNWTFALAGPQSIWNSAIGKISELKDCITTWEGTKESINNLSVKTSGGLQATYSNAMVGVRSTKNFFQPQVSGLTKSAVKSALNNVTSQFAKIPVAVGNGDLTISSVVTRAGHRFMVGQAYYQLTKKETVQDYKNMVVQNNATGELFSGTPEDVKDLLGLPIGGTIELNPVFNGKFTIFVRSTSWNRKLVPSTVLLYRIK